MAAKKAAAKSASKRTAKKTAKKAPAKKAAAKSESPDLATSGRDAEMAAEDASGEEMSDTREAQMLRATGGGGQGVAPALQSVPSSSLNPAFHTDPEDQSQADDGDSSDDDE